MCLIRMRRKNLEGVTPEGAARTDTPLVTENSSTLSHTDGSNKHIYPNIQHDRDLWQHVHEYNQRMAEIPFTPILSKKKKQKLKQA